MKFKRIHLLKKNYLSNQNDGRTINSNGIPLYPAQPLTLQKIMTNGKLKTISVHVISPKPKSQVGFFNFPFFVNGNEVGNVQIILSFLFISYQT